MDCESTLPSIRSWLSGVFGMKFGADSSMLMLCGNRYPHQTPPPPLRPHHRSPDSYDWLPLRDPCAPCAMARSACGSPVWRDRLALHPVLDGRADQRVRSSPFLSTFQPSCPADTTYDRSVLQGRRAVYLLCNRRREWREALRQGWGGGESAFLHPCSRPTDRSLRIRLYLTDFRSFILDLH